ncbi:epimerase [Candidatus Wolfebacteria bacterium CG03_land_8_20_14_0_80_36_15]|uniref:Epimerase n=1 Tax=Candidatus Wolfebacteria bacterium CG03_land_8_20_14_0_80_36_15 TaxID=1975067 RepID=A0A2M7B7K6_9BACT|nr:MAG: epimerase [Candidatus Wolfebacteria bacterium CG03_land_8_20_14_0_80_36_15]
MKSSQEIIFEDIKWVIEKTDFSPLAGKRILLTGANGLIGSYFAHLFHYLNENLKIGLKADLITRSEISPKSRIYYLKNSPHLKIIQKDLSQYNVYTEPYDYVIHSAGYATPAAFLKEPLQTIDVNYIGLKSIFESFVKINPQARILYLSSSEIYGMPTPENFPTPETYAGNSSVTSTRACYVESKRLAEVITLHYVKAYGLAAKIARPALSYGPGMTFDDERVIGQFMKKANEKKVIDMIDDGRDLRCFCYLSDVLRQLVNVLLFAKDTIYNVGFSEEVSIRQLAGIIGELTGAKVIPGPGKTTAVIDAPSRVHLNLSKIQNEFGFKPAISLKEGLQRTIDWNLSRITELNDLVLS